MTGETTSGQSDRHVYVLDDEQWDAFMAALNAPPADNSELRALFNRKPAWENLAS